MIAGNCLGTNVALKFLNGLHHLTLCVYFSFHRRKSNDFCLIHICPTNWEGYKMKSQIKELYGISADVKHLVDDINLIRNLQTETRYEIMKRINDTSTDF